jgi:hypothetical protein
MRIRNTVLRRAAVGAVSAAVAASAAAAPPSDTADVPDANGRAVGAAPPDVLTSKLEGRLIAEVVRAQGSYAVENPVATGVGGTMIPYYGYYGDGPMIGAYGAVQTAATPVEASKSEPDKNTYLVLNGQHGADLNYDYGTHFLFQGHELGKKDANGAGHSFISRINLDADVAHRVTVLAATDVNGNFIWPIDGSTWDPFAKKLIFTTENAGAPTYQATPDYPSAVTDISGVIGRGGYEGVQVTDKGDLWIVEDIGGSSGSAGAGLNHAKQPNSFLYRLVPNDPTDLTAGGKLQVLQVASKAHAGPMLFHAGQADADITSQDVTDLHTYGMSFPTTWVTIHDTAIDGFAPFNANTAAKTKGVNGTAVGTPFKRPENGVFRPDGKFRDFFFTETGDTNSLSEAGASRGAFGGLFRVSQSKSDADGGTLTLFYLSDAAHSGFDNISFLTKDEVLVVEDAGDTLHAQRNALDSMYLFDVGTDYGAAGRPQPIRVLAQGRDVSATYDSGVGGSGFQNEGDNEITGIHVSDGDPKVEGVFGKKEPHPFHDDWRIFYTRQHGDNVTFEIVDLGDAKPTPPDHDKKDK